MSFFNQVTTQRRARNKTLRIKNKNGEWLEEEGDITEAFIDFYRDIFKLEEEENLELVGSYIKKRVDEQMNGVICKEVFEE